MKIESNAFKDGSEIPQKYTCDGIDLNPPILISDIPDNTKSLAIILRDPDSPSGNFIHWLVWNINPQISQINEGSIPDGAVEGTTDFGRTGWGGPCPHKGRHHCEFNIYALDTKLSLPESSIETDLLEVMDGHILNEAKLVGTYERV